MCCIVCWCGTTIFILNQKSHLSELRDRCFKVLYKLDCQCKTSFDELILESPFLSMIKRWIRKKDMIRLTKLMCSYIKIIAVFQKVIN